MSPSSQPSVKQSILHSSTRSEKKFRGQELSLGSIDVSPINSGANSPIDEHVSDGMWADGSQLNDQSTVGEDMLPDDEDMAAEIDSIFDADISVATVLSRQDLVRKGEEAIQQLKELLVSPGWKSESKHRSGVQVWTKRVEGDKMPIYRGDKVIEGFSPAEVMSIARHKKLWDEWYDRGNLVENLDNSTSLTSMVMKVHVPSTKPRDLVLVERLEEHPNILLFASTSVTTELCPPVPGRIRAHLRLYGWCLESCIGNTGHLSTKVTYILHTHIGGNAPHVLQKRVLSRRPLVIHAIEQYLHQHGPFNASFVDGDIDSKKDDDNSQDLLSNRVSMMPSAGHGDILAYVQRKTSHPQVITSTSTTDEKEIAKEELVDKADEPQEVQTADSSLKANSSEKSSSRPNLQVSFVEPDNPHKITRPRENTLESELEAVAVPRLSFDLSGYTNNLPEIVPTEEPTIFVAEASLPEVTATNSNASSIVNQHNNSNNTALAEEDMPRPRSSNTSRPSSQLSRRQSATPILAPAHRHAKAIMAARDLTNQLSPLDVWQLQLEQRGVSIYTHQLPDKPMPAVRGDIVVKGWTIEEVMAVVRSLDCRQHWDERFDGGKIVEWLDARTALAHSAVKGSFPVSGRDFCVANEVRSDPETGTLQAVAVSVEDPSVPAQSKRVRAQLDLSAWILKTSPEDTTTVHMTYITQFDPRGSIPSSLVKAVQTQTPMCVAKVADYLTKYAPPPSISRTTLGRSNETFDAAKAIWSATFTSDATSAGQMRGAEVLLGRCTWSKTGYEITSNPANAELHRVEDGFRLILRDAGSVDIKIEKSTGKKATGTVLLNGKPFGTSQPAATTANQTTASTTTATPANVVSSATPRSIVKSSGTVNNMASVNSVNSSTSSNAMLRPRASAAVHTSQSSVGSIETRKSVGFSTATTVTAASLLPDPQLTSATTPVDSFFNDTTNISGILLTRKTRSETIPSMPVRVIRWQRLTDGQVAFVAFVAFLAFYLGLLYERYFIGGFLAWMQSE